MLEADVYFHELHLPRFFVFSAMLSVTEELYLFPLELVKTRLQVQGTPHVAASYAPYSGLANAFRTIFRQEGVKGFYKGLGPSITALVPTSLTYLGTYEFGRHRILHHISRRRSAGDGSSSNERSDLAPTDGQRVAADFAGGALAEVVSGLLWVPADLTSQRLQLQGPDVRNHLYSGPVDVVRKIVRAQGVMGLYVGYVPALLTHVPTSAILWPVYQQTKRVLLRKRQQRRGSAVRNTIDPNGNASGTSSSSSTTSSTNTGLDEDAVPFGESVAVHVVSGYFAGCVAAFATAPLDVVRVRMQSQGHSWEALQLSHSSSASEQSTSSGRRPPSGAHSPLRPTYRSVGHALWCLAREDQGVRSMWRGSSARALQLGIQSSMGLVFYDLLKTYSKG